MSEATTPHSGTIIRRLVIQRFRGIEAFEWNPATGLNFIIGGGDTGKSTVLDAISLLLSPTNSISLSEWDYWQRKVTGGFVIEAAISLPPLAGMNYQNVMVGPWSWDGAKPCQHHPDPDSASNGEGTSAEVYVIRVSGTDQLDLVHEIVQPNENLTSFSTSLRRAIGMVRLSSDDRHERDLRLVQGSALDRLLNDKGLKGKVASKLGETDFGEQLEEEAKSKLSSLAGSFAERQLPSKLDLGLTGGPGLSINALIGLTAQRNIGANDGVALPMAAWGAGTRRLAALTIALALKNELPIAVVDEIERGLEPYRQRSLVASLEASHAQVFATTHSAAAISGARAGALWYMTSNKIGRLEGVDVERHQRRDPEAFLSRLTVFAEGATEVGFVKEVLSRALRTPLLDHGLWIADGGGNAQTLKVLKAIAASGLRFSAFVDDEGESTGTWANLKSQLGPLLFQWPSGCLEENIIAVVPTDQLQKFIEDPAEEKTGERLRTLANRLGLTDDKSYQTIADTAASNLKKYITEAATGLVPVTDPPLERSKKNELKNHAQHWFKSEAGGRELAKKLFDLDLWKDIEATVLPFVNAVESALGLPQTPTLR